MHIFSDDIHPREIQIHGNQNNFGNNGNGFHMCLNFEDTFRYIENPILCEVTGYGTISDEFSDEYNHFGLV